MCYGYQSLWLVQLRFYVGNNSVCGGVGECMGVGSFF